MRTIRRVSHWDFHPEVRTGEDLSLGERAADMMRHGMGSWGFVFGFVGIMVGWMVYNGTSGFDPYPFILLNLILSTLAGIQGAILLIASKRADQIDAALAAHHLRISKDDAEMGRQIKQLLEQVHDMVEDITALHLEVERSKNV